MNIRLVRFLLIAAFGAVFINIYLSYNDTRLRNQNTEAVLHVYEITDKTAHLVSLLKDAKINQRNYIITGKPIFSDKYLEDVNNLLSEIKTLAVMTQDDSLQQQYTHHLTHLLSAKTDELNLTISLYDQKNQTPILKIIEKDSITADSALYVVNKMIDHEQDELKFHKEKLEKTSSLSAVIRYINQSFVVITLLIAIFILSYQHSKIRELLSKLQNTNQQLEKQVQERTAELRHANEEMQSTNEQLNALNMQLNTLNEEKNQFIGMAAHDLKSPINSIKGLVQLFQADADNLTNEQKEYLHYMNQSTGRMISLISDILNVNKIEQGRQNLKLEKFNLYHFIEDIAFGLKITAEKKNIKIYLKTNDEKLVVNSDKNAIAQILENLLSNAIKFSPTDRNIYININKKESNSLLIEVKDEGQGIKKDEIPHLFEKFKKLSSRPTAGEDSTGLGLSIVKSLVDSLHGTIYVESEYGTGTSFFVELPVS
jgi:signal transduction histidine kinase